MSQNSVKIDPSGYVVVELPGLLEPGMTTIVTITPEGGIEVAQRVPGDFPAHEVTAQDYAREAERAALLELAGRLKNRAE